MLLTVILLLCGGLAAAGTTKSIKACIAFMIVYGWFYNITIGSTAYILLTEVATSRLRVKTIAYIPSKDFALSMLQMHYHAIQSQYPPPWALTSAPLPSSSSTILLWPSLDASFGAVAW